MKFNTITIFPELISHYCSQTILGRAQANRYIDVQTINLRAFTDDKRQTVDDTPYGGGAGMVMKPEPIYKALKSIDAIPFKKVDGLTKLKKVFNGSVKQKKRTVVMSPRGRQFDQRVAETWASLDELTIICGRYEGIDQRVIDHMIDEEISVGPYVLAGGELGAMVVIEAVSRLIPGVLGNPDSLVDETFSERLGTATTMNLTPSRVLKTEPRDELHHTVSCSKPSRSEYPQYTKPLNFMGWAVPDILLSGDHKKIEDWRNGGE